MRYGIAALDHPNPSLNCRAEILRIGNGPFGLDAHAFREHRVVDIGIRDLGSDFALVDVDAAIVLVGHALQLHDLLMIRAVVVHHGEQRDAMMRGGPQDSVSHHQIAVGLNGNAEPAMFLVGDGGSQRGRRKITDAFAARAADELIMLGEIPKAQRPVAHPERIRHERPIFVLDLTPQFGGEARGATGLASHA